MAKFVQIPSHSSNIKDRILRSYLEPIRDAVQRRFQGASTERVVTREDLVTLGLVTRQELNKLKD